MDYGVISTGFNLKRFDTIKTEVEDELRDAFGNIDTDADSVFGQIIGVFSRHLAEIWEQSENIYNAMYPSTAEGVNLDNSCSIVAVTRLAASASTAVVQLLGTESTVIPLASTFSQSLTTKVFETIEEVTISLSEVHKAVITVDTVTDITEYTITINGTDVDFTSGSSTTAQLIAEGLKNAINADPVVSLLVTASYTATDDFLTIISNDLTLAGIFTLVIDATLSVTELYTPVAVECTETGAIPVPLGSIDTVDTPISGLDSVTNLTEGTTGRNLETDAELRIRRRNSLNIIAAGTLGSILARITQDIPEVSAAFIFENDTGDIDAYGRPGHSFEVVVSALDTVDINQSIADKIWERKPAGIATYGTTSVTVVDSNGDNQTVYFTHAITKYVHIKLEYDTTGADAVYPLDGDDLIKAAVMELGETLTFGSDLLVQRFAACGYAAGGVTDVTASVAVTNAPGDTPSWQTTNLTVAAADLPSFDLTRITLIDVTP
jgi:uncharacterized phage protein gp47/JayE